MNTSSCLSNRYYLESNYSQTILVFESLLFSLSIRTLHCFSPNLLLLLLLLDTTIYLEDAFCMNPNCLISLHLLTLGYNFLQYILCEYTYSIHCTYVYIYTYIQSIYTYVVIYLYYQTISTYRITMDNVWLYIRYTYICIYICKCKCIFTLELKWCRLHLTTQASRWSATSFISGYLLSACW